MNNKIWKIGILTLMLFLSTLIIFPSTTAYEQTHIYVCDGVNAKAYEGGTIHTGLFNEDDAEFTADDYQIISINDTNGVDDVVYDDGFQYHRFDFTIDEDINSISRIDIIWIGRGSDGDDVINGAEELFVKENDNWVLKDYSNGRYKSILTVTYNDNFDDIILSGHLHVGAYSPLAAAQVFPPDVHPDENPVISILSSDYVEVRITYTSFESQLEIIAPSIVIENENFHVTIKANSVPIEGVSTIFDGVTYYSNNVGVVNLTAPSVDQDTDLILNASKSGFLSDETGITIQDNISSENQLVINAPYSVIENNSFQVIVTSDGDPIENTMVTFKSSTKYTNVDGIVTFNSPLVEYDSSYQITTSKIGYLPAEISIIILNSETLPENQLVLSVPSTVYEEEIFQVTVTANNIPVNDVIVVFNDLTYYSESNGKVTLSAPVVTLDTSYIINASKTGYKPAEAWAIVKNQNKSVIQLKIPNGGEIWSQIKTIQWDIIDESILPTAITVQYKYKYNAWVNIIENLEDFSQDYSWDTSDVISGYPYWVKIILKQDTDSDGIYETNAGEDVSDAPFAIDNTETHEGWISGMVYEAYENMTLPIEGAKVYIIISEINATIISKSTKTDENGLYMLSATTGTYKLKASCDGYITSYVEGIKIWANENTEIEFIIQKGTDDQSDTPPSVITDNQKLIEQGIQDNKVGGEITIYHDLNQISYKNNIILYNSLNINPTEVQKEKISLLVDSETKTGKTIIINIAQGIFDSKNTIQIKYDSKDISMAEDILDVLDPENDNNYPEYLITYGENGIQILVSMPEFSQHTITLYAKTILQYIEYIVIISLIILFIATRIMFRKEKDEI